MDIHDSQRIKEIRDNTAKMADAFTRIADALERLTDRKTEPIKIVMPKAHGRKQAFAMIDEIYAMADRNNSEKPNNCEDLQDWKDRMWAEAIVTEPQPTTDCRQTDCYMCKWLGEVDVCGRCRNRNLFAEADTEPKPKDEPITQTKTQNSNLTFEKADEFKQFDREALILLIECQKERIAELLAKDEPQTNGYQAFNGTSVYVSRIEDEPQTEEHCENCRHKDECEGATYEYKNTEWWCLAYAPIDEPQTEEWYTYQDEQEYNEKCQTDCPWK